MLKPLKTGRSTDRFGGPALALHGTYFRGNAIRTLFDHLVTRNHKLGSFKTTYRAAQVGDWVVVNGTKALKNKAKHRSLSGPALAPHEIDFRGNAIRAVFDGLATRNYQVGSFKTTQVPELDR